MNKILSKMAKNMRFIDIGANLTDDMYKGLYNHSKKHEADLSSVLKRCWDNGMDKMIITAGNLNDIEAALKMTELDERLYSTVGCHPTRCNEFKNNPEEYLSKLKDFVKRGGKKIVALGECGLDYDRLKFCSVETQKEYFSVQLQLCEELNLPLFLHCRAAYDDFFEIISQYDTKFRGVVHSFDGTAENMLKLIDMGFYIGINGCSLKTEANLEVAAKIPADRLLIETDCPWCEIRPTHAGAKYVKTKYPSVKKEKFSDDSLIKGRNEPINIMHGGISILNLNRSSFVTYGPGVTLQHPLAFKCTDSSLPINLLTECAEGSQVLEVLAAIRGEEAEGLSQKILDNTNKLFFS